MSASMLQHMCSLDESSSNYQQQRKRRAGMSSGSMLVAQNSTVSNGFATLGGRSPQSGQSSFDSNQDIHQISMNVMRVNGLGTGSMRPLLTTSPKCSQSQTHLVRVPSSRKVQANLSLEEDSLTLHYDRHHSCG
ncbi:hypothetical protein WR25_04232 [Diploscapter pachys]|uniref:Uncharacterized protein n=1 Tax=Diploscapter pachys TaxID=2018661 RepID=A0A2A2K1E9_9BILA|nr:hypothetical protein WR25_04232 [Diploscapter pachys]